jgi:hypothetical protein
MREGRRGVDKMGEKKNGKGQIAGRAGLRLAGHRSGLDSGFAARPGMTEARWERFSVLAIGGASLGLRHPRARSEAERTGDPGLNGGSMAPWPGTPRGIDRPGMDPMVSATACGLLGHGMTKGWRRRFTATATVPDWIPGSLRAPE